MTDLLKRGTPVIINDADAPETRLVAILSRYDSASGQWWALYLSTYTHMKECCTDRRPTPLSEFGVKLQWASDGEDFRCVPTGAPVTAKYHDGVPRRWQERNTGKMWRSRVRARKLFFAHILDEAL